MFSNYNHAYPIEVLVPFAARTGPCSCISSHHTDSGYELLRKYRETDELVDAFYDAIKAHELPSVFPVRSCLEIIRCLLSLIILGKVSTSP
jgi:hypothetical protein